MRVPNPEDEPTVDLWPLTGKALGLSRSSTYLGAENGEIPTIRVGRRIRVPTAALRRMLDLDDSTQEIG